ncbi:hypothetical protein KDD17_18335 [Sulfitobacter albidus]|uniref:Uncharacterized protein n=1 Tax=Sulfitobacter albidus TaxID=2829501 RepID=A0A975PP00_9RHOB|nr:hypothetical protein [Sulfitobacter albidus]QUJ78348.1 hypothetical protein KDD17_18335 [Sulfitobacter albidus]
MSSFQKTVAKDDANWTKVHFARLREFVDSRRSSAPKMALSTEPDWVMAKFAQVADERVKMATLAAQLGELQKQRTLLKTS